MVFVAAQSRLEPFSSLHHRRFPVQTSADFELQAISFPGLSNHRKFSSRYEHVPLWDRPQVDPIAVHVHDGT